MSHKEEIERKFLIDPEHLPELPPGARLVQGYLGFKPTVRVRVEEGPDAKRKAYLTIKGPGLVGREEFEYDLPPDEADELLKLAQTSLVSKTRYCLPAGGAADLKWEIDVFDGENKGLAVAEIELPSKDCPFDRPGWLGDDVTEDPAYQNANLSQHPYRSWKR